MGNCTSSAAAQQQQVLLQCSSCRRTLAKHRDERSAGENQCWEVEGSQVTCKKCAVEQRALEARKQKQQEFMADLKVKMFGRTVSPPRVKTINSQKEWAGTQSFKELHVMQPSLTEKVNKLLQRRDPSKASSIRWYAHRLRHGKSPEPGQSPREIHSVVEGNEGPQDVKVLVETTDKPPIRKPIKYIEEEAPQQTVAAAALQESEQPQVAVANGSLLPEPRPKLGLPPGPRPHLSCTDTAFRRSPAARARRPIMVRHMSV